MTPEEKTLLSLVEALYRAERIFKNKSAGILARPQHEEEDGFITHSSLASYKEKEAAYEAQLGSLAPFQKALDTATATFEAWLPKAVVARLNAGIPMILPAYEKPVKSVPHSVRLKGQVPDEYIAIIEEQEALMEASPVIHVALRKLPTGYYQAVQVEDKKEALGDFGL